jgi:WD repeat-containing protein 35
MSVDTNLYFANIKLEYKWGFINNQVLVFAYQKLDRVEFSVIFWNIANDKKHIKFLRNLIHIKAAGDMCCLITEIDEETWQIDLCNSIGSPIDTKMINVHPVMASMTKTHIIVCSEDNVYIW